MGLYLVGRHGELQALGWALGEGARDGGRQGAGHASHVQPLTLSLPAGRCARLLKEVSLRPQLSPGLTGVPAHSRSLGLQGADARLPRGGPGGWGGQGREGWPQPGFHPLGDTGPVDPVSGSRVPHCANPSAVNSPSASIAPGDGTVTPLCR